MDMQMKIKRKLYSPDELKEKMPMTDKMKAIKDRRDKELVDILTGKSDRMMLVIGPCSADREDAVLEYIGRLKKVKEKVEEKVLIVPRIYTNKPRTTGEGYK